MSAAESGNEGTGQAAETAKRSERPTSGEEPSHASATILKQAMLTTRKVSIMITPSTARTPSSAGSSDPSSIAFSGSSSS